jgi:hypothetical protein
VHSHQKAQLVQYIVTSSEEDMMRSGSDLWRAVRRPLLVLAVAGLGIVVASALDRTAAREWALTIGGPALTVLLPVGLVWLVVAVIVYVVKRRGGRPTSPP